MYLSSDLNDGYTFDDNGEEVYIDESLRYQIYGRKTPAKVQVLTDKELFEKTKSIFEEVTSSKITIQMGNFQHNLIEQNQEGNYKIYLKSPPESGLPMYVALSHELAHVLFDSLNINLEIEFDTWAKDLPIGVRNLAKKAYFSVFNLLEDQRIESLLGMLYAGTGIKFDKSLRELGKKLKPLNIVNPIWSLQAARMYREDMVHKDHSLAIELMAKVKLTGKSGALIYSRKYCKEVINPILSELDIPNSPVAPRISTADGKTWEMERDSEGIERTKEISQEEYIKKENEGNNADRKWQKAKNEILDKKEEIMNEACKVLQKNDHEKLNDNEEKQGSISADYDKSDSQLTQEGIREVNIKRSEIEEANLNTSYNETNETVGGELVKKTVREGNLKVNADHMVSRYLNKTFKSIVTKPKVRLDDYGEAINIPALIRKKATGFGSVFNKMKRENSLTILFAVDGSGSMRTKNTNGKTRYEIMGDLMATLFDSIQGVKQLQFDVVMWSADRAGNLSIVKIKNKADCKNIVEDRENFFTPTHLALKYCGERLNKMSGRKKMLIFMSDGYPEYHKGNNSISSKVLTMWATKEAKGVKSKGINLIGLYMGAEHKDQYMKEIFGKDLIPCRTMEEIKAQAIRKIRLAVRKLR